MEEQLQEMNTSQKGLAEEIEGVRADCQRMTASLQGIDPQITYAEESKKQVSPAVLQGPVVSSRGDRGAWPFLRSFAIRGSSAHHLCHVACRACLSCCPASPKSST